MDWRIKVQEYRLRRAASRNGMKARKVTEPHPIEDVLGLWDFAHKDAIGAPRGRFEHFRSHDVRRGSSPDG